MDTFTSYSQNLNSPIRSGAPITPNYGSDLPVMPRAIYVGIGGDLAVILADGDSVTLAAVPGGIILPVRARRVRQSGTSASALVALW